MPIRVLLLHNRYRSEGGEERAVADIAALLERRGHVVAVLERESSRASRARAAEGMLRGGLDADAVARAVSDLAADVVHAHNVHPLFGWRALAAARTAGAATVLHLHNYRLFCSIAVGYRDGGRCFQCRGRRTLPAVVHRCRGSVAESAVYAAGIAGQQRQLLRHADALVAVSEAVAQRLGALGVPAERLTALPNFAPDGSLAAASEAGRGRYALAAGRLVEEKGYDVAILASRAAGVPLVIAGEGPDEGRLAALAGDGEVTFTGHVAPARLAGLRAEAAVALVPSRWEEPFPYAALEAMAAGVPVLAADRGGLPEAVGPDSVVAAEDVAAWARALRELWEAPDERRRRGDAAIARARERFSEDAYYRALTRVYAVACTARAAGAGPSRPA